MLWYPARFAEACIAFDVLLGLAAIVLVVGAP
jgi:hypothetical protein